MTASELLKRRLYPVMDGKRLTLTEAAAIISVVEAAEAIAPSANGHMGKKRTLLASLAALREHLEGRPEPFVDPGEDGGADGLGL